MAEKHFHVYSAAAQGPIKAYTTRASDTFRTRAAAQKWASSQRSGRRKVIRQCEGGPECPGAEIDSWERDRPPLPQTKARRGRRRSKQLTRLRVRLDAMAPAELATLEGWLDSAGLGEGA